MTNPERTFLGSLLKKLSDVQTGNNDINTNSLQNEAKRQIRQATKDGDIVKGKGVTKSGEED